MGKLLRLHKFAEDKPGLEAFLENAENNNSRSLDGKLTIAAMCDMYGVELTPERSRMLGRALAANSRSQEMEAPTKVRRRFKDSSNNFQSYMVSEYSTGYLPLFESLCRSYGYITQ